MSRPSAKEPVVVSSKAAERLAAIYRQHKPDQPALVVGLGKALSLDKRKNQSEGPYKIVAAAIDAALTFPNSASNPGQGDSKGWQRLRAIPTELYVTCNTLRRLKLLHGALGEVTFLDQAVICKTPRTTALLNTVSRVAGCSRRQLRYCTPSQNLST